MSNMIELKDYTIKEVIDQYNWAIREHQEYGDSKTPNLHLIIIRIEEKMKLLYMEKNNEIIYNLEQICEICKSHYKEFLNSSEITNFSDIHLELKKILFKEFSEKKIMEAINYVN